MKTLIIIFLIYALCKKKDVMGGLMRGGVRTLNVVIVAFKSIWQTTWIFWCKAIMEYQCINRPDDAKEIRKVWASWYMFKTNYKKWSKLHPNKFEEDDAVGRTRHYEELRSFSDQEWTDCYGSYGPAEGVLILSGITLFFIVFIFIPIAIVC